MTVQEESADCWLARWGGARKSGVLDGWAALVGMKLVVVEGGSMQEEEGMGSCMVWLHIADGMKAEALTCAAAAARLISRPPKLALHACMLFISMLCYSKTIDNHVSVCVRLGAYVHLVSMTW